MGITFKNFTAEAKEVANYKDALFIGFERLQEKGILSLSDIEEINKPVNKKMHNIRTNLPNFKNDLTRIANRKANGEIEILYTPHMARISCKGSLLICLILFMMMTLI